ncbi:MAG: hypothetical protein KAI79_17125 [Bacteroidales bacterium]|nr:hypothetical protein [Bacteroidales bacterium]
MENIIELTKMEAIEINGGDAYDVGYKVGKFFADAIDFIEGIADGIVKGFEAE